MEDDKEDDGGSDSFTSLHMPVGLAFSDSDKTETLADSFVAQFQPVNVPSEPAVNEICNEAMRKCEHAPASETNLSSSSDVL
jgi:hypothetical protein